MSVRMLTMFNLTKRNQKKTFMMMRSNIEIEDEQIVEKGDTVWDTV